MHCAQCGTELQAGVKFCAKCGTAVESAAETAATTMAGTSGRSAGQQGETQESVSGQQGSGFSTQQATEQLKPYVDQGKKAALNYFQFIKGIIKAPTRIGETVRQEQQINAYITMVLLALVLPLGLYFRLKNAFGDFGDISFFDVVLKPFFFLLLTLGIVSAVMYGVSNLMKAKASAFDVVSRFGTFLVIPLVLFVGATVLSIVSLKLGAILIALGAAAIYIAVNFTVYSFKTEEGLDPFFGVLIVYVVVAITAYYYVKNFTASLDFPL